MKASDIVSESAEYGVLVTERNGGAWFYAGSFTGSPVAWCWRETGKGWTCANSMGTRYSYQSKVQAYHWCLDQAANGPQ